MKKLILLVYVQFIFLMSFARIVNDNQSYCTKIIVQDSMEVSLYSPSMFRIRISHLTGVRFPFRYEISFAMGKLIPWPKVHYIQKADDRFYYVFTDSLQIQIARRGLQWMVLNRRSGKQIYPSSGPQYGMFKDGYTVFDNAGALNTPSKISRFTHWFYNPATQNYTDIYLGEDLIEDQFFIYGPSYKKLFSQMNELVGPEPLLPKKGYGFFQTQHLACEGTQEQLMEVARNFREKNIPLDHLILDFEWGDACDGNKELTWGSRLDWSKNYSYPLTPSAMIRKLDSMHIDVMLIHHSAGDFKNRKHQGWTETLYDESTWWSKYIEKLKMGIRGTWQDTRINDITDSYIYHRTQDYYGDKKRVLMLGSRKVMAYNPWDFRFSTMPTENMMGARRYPFHWTEDCSFSWNEMAFQLKAINNTWGPMSGYSYLASDMVGADWRIQARWNQFSALSAVTRSHHSKPWSGTIKVNDFISKIQINGRDTIAAITRQETIQTETAEQSIRKYLQLRYRLLPYIYSYAHVNYLTGMPVTRPLLLAFPDDYMCSSDTWPYQFMLGDYMMVAPVYGDFNTMEIYLPAGDDWIDYHTGKEYSGGVLTYNTSDINLLPIFIKKGAIIPMKQPGNWINTRQEDTITLDIYPSGKRSAFDLLEDDGESILYQKGAFSKTIITCQEGNDNLLISISPADGEYEGKPVKRVFRARINGIANEPASLSMAGVNNFSWKYDPAEKTILIEFLKQSDTQAKLLVGKK